MAPRADVEDTPMGAPVVLIVDRDMRFRRKLARLVSRKAVVRTTGSLAEARRLLCDHPRAALIVDLDLDDGCGLALIEGQRPAPSRAVLVLTATDDVRRISRACMLGAKFISKRELPALIRGQVCAFVERADGRQRTYAAALTDIAMRAGLTGAELDTLRLFVLTGDRSSLGEKIGIAETSVRSRVRGVCRKLGILRLSEVYRLLFEQTRASVT